MLLPAFTDARQFLGRRALSYSEMSKLNHCDMQWNLIYNTDDRESYPASPQMELGTLMHSMLNTWWGHGTWDQFLDPTDTSYENHETASWLIDRYDTVYRDTKLKMLEVNVPFAVKYNGYWLFGWFDGIVQDENGDLWVAHVGGRRVVQLSPAGDVLSEIPVPAKWVTSVAFGGPDWSDLYLVSADNTDDPAKKGGIWRCRPGVAGLPTPLARV
jgi:hypothetical protein